MKTEQEIKEQLLQITNDFYRAKAWHEQSLNKYIQDKRDFGSADSGELETAHQEVVNLQAMITTLNWVLNVTP